MAEEDDLDFGDDDLDLDDDSSGDSGDDFAGELDDMMGDDELGGDSGGADTDSDSELDSFFEDLSSIEDMDEGGGDVEGEEEPDLAPPDEKEDEKPAPVKAEKPKPAKEGGSKLKFIIPIIILLLAGGGGAYYFLIREPEVAMPEMTEPAATPQKPAMPEELPLKLEKIPVKPMVAEPEPPPPPKPVVPQTKYLVQVATCTYDSCKDQFIASLRDSGEPVYQKPISEKFDYIELISRQVFSKEQADSIAREINRKNQMAGNAFVVDQSNGYRVSMGTFPALDRAKEIKFHVESLFSKKEIIFNMEQVRKRYTTTKIFAGPYSSRTVAQKVLRELRKKEVFKGAYLVETKEPI